MSTFIAVGAMVTFPCNSLFHEIMSLAQIHASLTTELLPPGERGPAPCRRPSERREKGEGSAGGA